MRNLEATQPISPARADRAVLLGVWLVMFWMHFSAGPNDFVLDDWTNLKDFGQKPWAEIAHKAVTHPTRPVSLFFVMAVFRLFGDHPAAYYALSIVCQSGILFLILRLARALGLSRLHAAFAALGFTCWPMLSEMIRWPTMIAGAAACALPAYLAAMVGFVRYCREGGRARLAWAGAAYAAGIFSYESGIFLPAACLALVARSGWRRVIEVGATCAGLLVLYAGWRLSNAFGMGTFLLADQFKPDLNLATLVWNAKESVKLVANALFNHFLIWPITTLPVLCGIFTLLWIALARHRRRFAGTETGLIPVAGDARVGETAGFGLIWLVSGMLPVLIAYAAGRVLYLPMVGASLVAVPWLAAALRRPATQALLATLLLGVFLLNGMAQRDWIFSGKVQRGLRASLVAGNPSWRAEGHVGVLIKTQGFGPPGPPGWPYQFGQAGFLRGFALENLSFGVSNPLPVFLDVECGAQKVGDDWIWHERFRPEKVQRAKSSQVMVIDQRPPIDSCIPDSPQRGSHAAFERSK